MIEIKELKKGCNGVSAANGISLKLNNGAVYGILALSGLDRAAFLALLSGAIRPDHGVVRINGFDTVRESAQVSRCVGYMPKDLTPYPDMTPEEFLIFIAEARDIDYEEGMRSVHDALDQAELRGRKKNLCVHLTEAEKRRLCFAQALLGGSEILILDEPTYGLGERDASDMLDRIALLSDEKTIFLGSASLSTLRSVCDTVLVLSRGDLLGMFSANDPSLDSIFADLCEKNGQVAEQDIEDSPSVLRARKQRARRSSYTPPKKNGEYELIDDDNDQK